MNYQEMIDARIPIIFDGAMGTEIQKFDITKDDFQGKVGCNEMLNATRSDVIEKIYLKYLTAGANVIETNTFGGNRIKLEEYDIADRLVEINQSAVKAARNAIEEFASDKPLFICGSMGPTGNLLSSTDPLMNTLTFDQCSNIFAEQAEALMDGGADFLLLETMQDLLEVRAAMIGINRMFKRVGKSIPLQIQVTMDATGHMLFGSDVSSYLGSAANYNPTAMGLNCSTGPDEMSPLITELLNSYPGAVSMIANAGMPRNEKGVAYYDMNHDDFGTKVARMVTEFGVNIVGGCCGTNDLHIAALARELEGKRVKDRSVKKDNCFVSTGISGKELYSEKSPFIVGERLNTQGSRKTKELVLEDNYEELYQVALAQVDQGSTLLDLCMAVNERDNESETMTNIVRHLTERINIPFCMDSTDPEVFRTALKYSPGSVLINSINLEHNGDKAREILKYAAEYRCPVVALPIDDIGMAKTVERKLELTGKLVDIVCKEFGLPIGYIYLDPLVFTLATGEAETANAANDSLEALRKIKEQFPGIHTAMGVSNVSFGLRPKARRVMNNLMLHFSGIAGLDAAIFNPLHVDDVDSYDSELRDLAEDLLFNRKNDALNSYINYWENLDQQASTTVVKKDELENISPEKQLQNRVLTRDKRGLDELIAILLKEHEALDILNKILLPAMAEVGDKMATGEMILPFVLQAAEVMKASVNILEPHFSHEDGASRGKFVLATVFGDVHDIGKNLVASIIKNQGFEVIDMGKQVALDDIVDMVKKEKPDAVGLSALLVTTSKEMERCVKTFDSEGISIPIIIGGAAVNSKFAERIGLLEDGRMYAGKVFYAKDAFGALKVLDK